VSGGEKGEVAAFAGGRLHLSGRTFPVLGSAWRNVVLLANHETRHQQFMRNIREPCSMIPNAPVIEISTSTLYTIQNPTRNRRFASLIAFDTI
jgi:hypothetical protein